MEMSGTSRPVQVAQGREAEVVFLLLCPDLDFLSTYAVLLCN